MRPSDISDRDSDSHSFPSDADSLLAANQVIYINRMCINGGIPALSADRESAAPASPRTFALVFVFYLLID